MSTPLLEVRGLHVEFGPAAHPVVAVEGLDLEVGRGEVVGVVGESGSGKSVAMQALLGLIDAPGRVRATRIAFDGVDITQFGVRERRRVTGSRIGMIFQDPVASLDPSMTVGRQLQEVLRVHSSTPRARHRERALELLRRVEIPEPEARLEAYPHQMSGGMCQRVMIAIALASDPTLLIADEPTTALDVTVQAQIVQTLLHLQRERQMSMIMISHDLALVSEVAQRVVVMYAGEAFEVGTVPEIFKRPRHPYTRALMRSLPEANRGAHRLYALAGSVPGRADRPAGCLLAPRCPHADALCVAKRPLLHGGPAAAAETAVACHKAEQLEAMA